MNKDAKITARSVLPGFRKNLAPWQRKQSGSIPPCAFDGSTGLRTLASRPDRHGQRVAGRHGWVLCSLRESMDTTAPAGKLTFHIFGALA